MSAKKTKNFQSKVLLFICTACLFACGSAQDKYTGISLVGTSQPLEEENLSPILELGSNSISIMPFAYENGKDPKLIYKGIDWQWWGETPEGIEAQLLLAHEKGLKVMIKPQIWRWNGTYTGLLQYDSEAAWQAFEEDYLQYMLIYAKMAETHNAELLCIGTELGKFVEKRPSFWLKLIQEVRKEYHGKLTHASNWDDYKRVGFWGELDFIGVDAYFPLSSEQTPSISACCESWEKHLQDLSDYSDQHKRQIIFTEWGFRSADYCAHEPWNYDHQNNTNLLAQENALSATFESVWKKPWFAGGFLWKWFPNNEQSGGEQDHQFTPQNKPALQIIKKYFHQHKN